jgi:hypothetical protein
MSETPQAPLPTEALAEIRGRVDEYPEAVIYGPQDREALLAEVDRLHSEVAQLTRERDHLRRDRDAQVWGAEQIRQANPMLRNPLLPREDD